MESWENKLQNNMDRLSEKNDRWSKIRLNAYKAQPRRERKAPQVIAACLSFVVLVGLGWGFLWYAGLRDNAAVVPGANPAAQATEAEPEAALHAGALSEEQAIEAIKEAWILRARSDGFNLFEETWSWVEGDSYGNTTTTLAGVKYVEAGTPAGDPSWFGLIREDYDDYDDKDTYYFTGSQYHLLEINALTGDSVSYSRSLQIEWLGNAEVERYFAEDFSRADKFWGPETMP